MHPHEALERHPIETDERAVAQGDDGGGLWPAREQGDVADRLAGMDLADKLALSGRAADDAEAARQHQIETVGRIAGLVQNPAAGQAEPFELIFERQPRIGIQPVEDAGARHRNAEGRRFGNRQRRIGRAGFCDVAHRHSPRAPHKICRRDHSEPKQED